MPQKTKEKKKKGSLLSAIRNLIPGQAASSLLSGANEKIKEATGK
jgi:hypothetical protein